MVLSEVDLLGFTYRTGALVATHRECEPMQWLSIYFSDPLDCVPWVRRFTNCVGSYFVHSTNDNDACGCLTSDVDCTDDANTDTSATWANIYLLTPAPPPPPPPPALPPQPPTHPVDAGIPLSTAGTATASSTLDSFAAANVFDGVTNYWHSGADRFGQD